MPPRAENYPPDADHASAAGSAAAQKMNVWSHSHSTMGGAAAPAIGLAWPADAIGATSESWPAPGVSSPVSCPREALAGLAETRSPELNWRFPASEGTLGNLTLGSEIEGQNSRARTRGPELEGQNSRVKLEDARRRALRPRQHKRSCRLVMAVFGRRDPPPAVSAIWHAVGPAAELCWWATAFMVSFMNGRATFPACRPFMQLLDGCVNLFC